jgi:hypothetical protein
VVVGSLRDALHNYTLRFYKEFVDGAVEVDLHVARQPRSGVGGGASCPKLSVMNSLPCSSIIPSSFELLFNKSIDTFLYTSPSTASQDAYSPRSSSELQGTPYSTYEHAFMKLM